MDDPFLLKPIPPGGAAQPRKPAPHRHAANHHGRGESAVNASAFAQLLPGQEKTISPHLIRRSGLSVSPKVHLPGSLHMVAEQAAGISLRQKRGRLLQTAPRSLSPLPPLVSLDTAAGSPRRGFRTATAEQAANRQFLPDLLYVGIFYPVILAYRFLSRRFTPKNDRRNDRENIGLQEDPSHYVEPCPRSFGGGLKKRMHDYIPGHDP